MYCPNDQCPDFLTYGLRGEYREGITTCPRCGTGLLPGAPPVAPGASVPSQQATRHGAGTLVQVASFLTENEADLAVSFLASQGIDAVRRSDDCAGVHPGLAFSTQVRVLVPEEDADDAAELLSEATLEGSDGDG